MSGLRPGATASCWRPSGALLGFYVTGHPLDGFAGELGLYGVTAAEAVATGHNLRHRDAVVVAGVVAEYRERPLKSGNGRMAFLQLEDRTGSFEVLVFSSVFDACEEVLKSGDPVLIRGAYLEEGDPESLNRRVRAEEALRLEDVRRQKVHKICVRVRAEEIANGELDRLAGVLREHPGRVRTSLLVELDDHSHGRGTAELVLPEAFWADPGEALMQGIERIFRRPAVQLL